jgi:hypothetical protein
MTAMTTDEATKSNNTEPAQKASLQFGISIAVGVLTILLLAASYYFGLIH